MTWWGGMQRAAIFCGVSPDGFYFQDFSGGLMCSLQAGLRTNASMCRL